MSSLSIVEMAYDWVGGNGWSGEECVGNGAQLPPK